MPLFFIQISISLRANQREQLQQHVFEIDAEDEEKDDVGFFVCNVSLFGCFPNSFLFPVNSFIVILDILNSQVCL